jgi:FkbM family methyltransferase
VPARARGAVMRSIQRGVNRLGYEIVPWADGITEDEARRARLLAATGVDLVLDVGANAGQYASKLRRGGYQGRIVSFEPLSRAFAQLSAASVSDPSWECRRLALGATDGETEINVSGNSYSSSLLEMEERHVESAPESRYVGTEKIKTARLDSIWAELVRNGERTFLKLDVQGFELEVLRGAETSLPKTLGVQAELSLVPLYRDGPVFRDVIDYLEGRGFRLAGLEGGHDDRRTGEMLQADGIFIRA